MFVDAYLPDRIQAYPFTSSPRWSTSIAAAANGAEQRNQNWMDPLHRFVAPEAVRCMEDLETIKAAWYALSGPFDTFAFRDPLDFASRSLNAAGRIPAVGAADQVVGIGDGVTTQFQLRKAYVFGSRTYYRPIRLPVVSSVSVAMNALPPETSDPALPGGPYSWDVSRRGGILTVTPAPEPGVIVTAGFLFDVEVRFESDDAYGSIARAFGLGSYPDLVLVEVRPCHHEDSDT